MRFILLTCQFLGVVGTKGTNCISVTYLPEQGDLSYLSSVGEGKCKPFTLECPWTPEPFQKRRICCPGTAGVPRPSSCENRILWLTGWLKTAWPFNYLPQVSYSTCPGLLACLSNYCEQQKRSVLSCLLNPRVHTHEVVSELPTDICIPVRSNFTD